MTNNKEDIRPFVPLGEHPTVERYLEDMAKMGTWADHITLQALCTVYCAAVSVLTKGDNGDLTWFMLGDKELAHSCFCLYLEGGHYENLLVESQLV